MHEIEIRNSVLLIKLSYRYECSMNEGCKHYSADDTLDDVLVIQREIQTVRAVEPRTGQVRVITRERLFMSEF